MNYGFENSMTTEKDKTDRSLGYGMGNESKKPKDASLGYSGYKPVGDYQATVAQTFRAYAELEPLSQRGLGPLVSDADAFLRKHTNTEYGVFLRDIALEDNHKRYEGVPDSGKIDVKRDVLVYLAALNRFENEGGNIDEVFELDGQKPEFGKLFEALKSSGYSAYPVFERQTKLGNLILLSTPSLAEPQSALAISRKIKRLKEDLSVVSLELDKNLQPFLDAMFQEGKKVSYCEFPGLGYTIDLCVANGIPVFASDIIQQQYFREVMKLDLRLQRELSRTPSECLDKLVKEWAEAKDKLEIQRAEGTAKELRVLSGRVSGNVYHVASEIQAEIIDKVI